MGVHHDHARGAPGHPAMTRAASRRRLGLALALTLVGLAAEVVGGLVSNSLALLADAGHLLSDAGALGLAAFASWIAARPASPQKTYGYHRAEILAALANGAVLVAVSLLVVREGILRLGSPEPVRAGIMLGVAAAGLALNLACLVILAPARQAGINARAAFLHVVSDTLGSVGAIAAGACAWAFGWTRADAVASILIAVLVAWSAWSLLREAVAVLMEGAPSHVDVDEVRRAMGQVAGVCEVHDLHVWCITSGLVSLSGHVVVAESGSQSLILRNLQELLASRFGIHHVTLQLEPAGCDAERQHG